MVKGIDPQTQAKLVAASTLQVLSKAQIYPVPDNPALRLGLKPAPLMKEVIEAIAAKHGIDLYAGCPSISLRHDSGGSLYITKDQRNCISVHEYWHCAGDRDAYPKTIFWVSADHIWYPIVAHEDHEDQYESVTLDRNGLPDKVLDANLQECFAVYNSNQAARMQELDWLEDGKVTHKTQDKRQEAGFVKI